MKEIKQFSDLKDTTIAAIAGGQPGDDTIIFTLDDGRRFQLWHSQDCCESVNIEDVIGDISDLIGSPLLECEEVTNGDDPEGIDKSSAESYTWTFYKLATIKGSVTIRWYGESNGYYSESVDFCSL